MAPTNRVGASSTGSFCQILRVTSGSRGRESRLPPNIRSSWLPVESYPISGPDASPNAEGNGLTRLRVTQLPDGLVTKPLEYIDQFHWGHPSVLTSVKRRLTNSSDPDFPGTHIRAIHRVVFNHRPPATPSACISACRWSDCLEWSSPAIRNQAEVSGPGA